MAKCDAVISLMAAMKQRGNSIHMTAETIKKTYDYMRADCAGKWKVLSSIGNVDKKHRSKQPGKSVALPHTLLY